MTASKFHSGLIRTLSLLSAVLLVTLLLLSLDSPAPVQAGGTVSTCNEASLLTALNGGGTVTFTCDGTITLSATITISANTTLDATGHTVTLSGNNAVRILTLNTGISLTLRNLTFANGNSFTGGAIYDNDGGDLNIIGCTFTNNTASSGGAIATLISNQTTGGRLNISNSIFSNNTGNNASASAGAIVTGNQIVNITNSNFTNNSASSVGAILQSFGILTISNSTFSGNTATGASAQGFGSAGAINSASEPDNFFPVPYGLVITNSTFSGNSATNQGGALYLFGKALIINSTFSGNSATNQGGAIFQISQQGTLTTLKNTIVANSTSGGNCAGIAVIDGGNNLQFPGTTCGATIPTADPLLQALQNNGGPTQTMALTAGSPAIDAGNNQICAAPPLYNLDQRGAFRPAGANCDIGAYEANGVVPATLVVTNTTDSVNSPSAGSLRQIIAQAVSQGGAIITFSPSLGANPQITLAGALVVPSKVWIEASCNNKVSLTANFNDAFQLSGNNVIQGIVVINIGGTSTVFTGHGNRITCSQARKTA